MCVHGTTDGDKPDADHAFAEAHDSAEVGGVFVERCSDCCGTGVYCCTCYPCHQWHRETLNNTAMMSRACQQSGPRLEWPNIIHNLL